MATFDLSVNGARHTVEADPEMPLLWVLRDLLELTGTKYGCGVGACGSCIVHLDGQAVRSCITPVSEAAAGPVTTIEGLSPDGSHPLQVAWLAEDVPQCGYCMPGQIMAAAALLSHVSKPDDGAIDAALRHNVCRCGTYQRIRRAIHRAAEGV